MNGLELMVVLGANDHVGVADVALPVIGDARVSRRRRHRPRSLCSHDTDASGCMQRCCTMDDVKTDPKTSARMARVRSRDTAAEMAVRRELHRRGRRFFVQRPVLPGRRRVDIVFPRARLAIFVDGCFWHSCPLHATSPVRNAEWWETKLARNVARDRSTDTELAALEWGVLRVWEHESASAAADRIERALADAKILRGRHHEDR